MEPVEEDDRLFLEDKEDGVEELRELGENEEAHPQLLGFMKECARATGCRTS